MIFASMAKLYDFQFKSWASLILHCCKQLATGNSLAQLIERQASNGKVAKPWFNS